MPGRKQENEQFFAGVAKLVDVSDLGSDAARHGGSSPSTRTTEQENRRKGTAPGENFCMTSCSPRLAVPA